MAPQDIGWAIRALKNGEQVRRAGWRGKDKFLVAGTLEGAQASHAASGRHG